MYNVKLKEKKVVSVEDIFNPTIHTIDLSFGAITIHRNPKDIVRGEFRSEEEEKESCRVGCTRGTKERSRRACNGCSSYRMSTCRQK